MTDHQPLPYLSAEDTALLLGGANRETFDADDVIIQEGSQPASMYFIREGAVRVERSQVGNGITIARLAEGEFFGEMSFLEDRAPGASVVADQRVVLDVIDQRHLQAVVTEHEAFAGRFFRSLAVVLSQRLRGTAALLPPLMVEEIPQVNRFHAERSIQVTAGLPQKLITAVARFNQTLAAISQEMGDGGAVQDAVSAACTAVEDALRDHVTSHPKQAAAGGCYVFRETFSWFMRSHLMDRAYTKPRGFSGDYGTLRLIHRDAPEGDGPMGRCIDRWALSRPPAPAVRNRRAYLRQTIEKSARAWAANAGAGATPVACLGGAPAPELFDLLRLSPDVGFHARCIDIDGQALTAMADTARRQGVEPHFTFSQDNVRRLTLAQGRTAIPPQWFVYAVSMAHYLDDQAVVRLLDWTHRILLPGGTMVLGSFHPDNPTRPLLDHVVEWRLNHRTEAQLHELVGRSAFGNAAIENGPDGVQQFVICRKPA